MELKIMRFSEGMSKGRFAEINNPEMFNENEEVIVFTREEFSWVFRSMLNQINYVNDIALKLDNNESWKLMGYWPKIMERIRIIDINMDMLLTEKPEQAYLDAYIFNTGKTPIKLKSVVTKEKVPIQQTLIFQNAMKNIKLLNREICIKKPLLVPYIVVCTDIGDRNSYKI